MLKQLRCKKCNKLLAKISDYSELEIKCNRCKQINYYIYTQHTEKPNDPQQRPFILANALRHDK